MLKMLSVVVIQMLVDLVVADRVIALSLETVIVVFVLHSILYRIVITFWAHDQDRVKIHFKVFSKND